MRSTCAVSMRASTARPTRAAVAGARAASPPLPIRGNLVAGAARFCVHPPPTPVSTLCSVLSVFACVGSAMPGASGLLYRAALHTRYKKLPSEKLGLGPENGLYTAGPQPSLAKSGKLRTRTSAVRSVLLALLRIPIGA